MDKRELLLERQMTYGALVNHLRGKYGPAKYNYYCTPECRTKNKKVTRTNEGLICHHIREDVAELLASPREALRHPYEYQMADNLVYCNYLEHLLLHICIGYHRDWENFLSDKIYHSGSWMMDREGFQTKSAFLMSFWIPESGGMDYIKSDCNSMYGQDGSTVPWRMRCYEEIRDNYEDYVDILAAILQRCADAFVGDKEYIAPQFKVGARLRHKDGTIDEVVEVTSSINDDCWGSRSITFRDQSGKNRTYLEGDISKGTYTKQMAALTRYFSTDADGNVINDIYDAISHKLENSSPSKRRCGRDRLQEFMQISCGSVIGVLDQIGIVEHVEKNGRIIVNFDGKSKILMPAALYANKAFRVISL